MSKNKMIPLEDYILVNYDAKTSGRSTERGIAIKLFADSIGKHRQHVCRWLTSGDIFVNNGELYRKLKL